MSFEQTQNNAFATAFPRLAILVSIPRHNSIALLCALLIGFAIPKAPAFGAIQSAVSTTLYTFSGGSDGGWLFAGLVQGSDGNFYGTTLNGGSKGDGTVFKITADGSLTTLHSFTGNGDGTTPWAPLIQGSDGFFYGITVLGGADNAGSVFKVNADGSFTNLHFFSGSDGFSSPCGLVLGGDGFFYGTTVHGGTNGGNGTVFKIDLNGALTSLYSFTGGSDGQAPFSALVFASDGNFYGTTSFGGTYDGGTVFRITSGGKLTSLHSFAGTGDGDYPTAGLVQLPDGYLYGITFGGGSGPAAFFKMNTNGAFTVLGHLPAGEIVWNTLTAAGDGNLYGTSAGAIFQINTNGQLTFVYSASESSDFRGSLIQAQNGNFYGTTVGDPGPGGTVFSLSLPTNQFVSVNQMLVITNYASSTNGPISFMLGSNSPPGASITSNGVFTWEPICEQGGTTNAITIWATDSATPPLTTSTTFNVVVGNCVEVGVGSGVAEAGGGTCVPVNLFTTVGLTNLQFTVASPSGFLTNLTVSSTNSAIASATVGGGDGSQWEFNFGVQNGQVLQGTTVIGSICLGTLNGNSAFVPLVVTNIDALAAATNNPPPTNVAAQTGRVVVIGPQSLLEALLDTNSNPALTVYGHPGETYGILSTTNLLDVSSWTPWGSVTMSGLSQVISLGRPTNQIRFFEAVQP
jgi:uncharacterized repeat protein (TIGR03803 family)